MKKVKRIKETIVSIPLKSGHIVTNNIQEEETLSDEVSIPLKSGHIVTQMENYQNTHLLFQSP